MVVRCEGWRRKEEKNGVGELKTQKHEGSTGQR
jgi:hypothetical protein